MIINLSMNIFGLDLLKSENSNFKNSHMPLANRCCRSLKRVDEDLQDIKAGQSLRSFMSGVDPFKAI